jgi:hypothetical protein
MNEINNLNCCPMAAEPTIEEQNKMLKRQIEELNTSNYDVHREASKRRDQVRVLTDVLTEINNDRNEAIYYNHKKEDVCDHLRDIIWGIRGFCRSVINDENKSKPVKDLASTILDMANEY